MRSRRSLRFIACLLPLFVCQPASHAESGLRLPMDAAAYEHITFRRIAPSHYRFHDGQLSVSVDHSASFMMYPLDRVTAVTEVSFLWRNQGEPAIRDSRQEKLREGDDALFKLGLLLKSEEFLFNPLLPSWMKKVESLLVQPSAHMINLVVAARHRPGEQWPNPYNKRVTMIAVASQPAADGWQRASYRFASPRQVVAFWLMADGDNTGSRFSVEIRDIIIR